MLRKNTGLSAVFGVRAIIVLATEFTQLIGFIITMPAAAMAFCAGKSFRRSASRYPSQTSGIHLRWDDIAFSSVHWALARAAGR